jgi:DnaJ-class molecular chaperone
MKDAASYYSILGVAPDATQEQIRKAYHVKALLHHPDRKAHAQKDGAFSKISHACAILLDKRKRSEYDAAMNLGRQEVFMDDDSKASKLSELEGNESFRALQWMGRVSLKTEDTIS